MLVSDSSQLTGAPLLLSLVVIPQSECMLTDSDYRYLRRNKRRFKMTRSEANEALAAANVPQIDAFIDFQSTYAGYNPEEDVTYGIVGLAAQPDGEPRSDCLRDVTRARCDLDNRIQIRFWIDENGLFYYEQSPVAETFESYVRFQAYCELTLGLLGWTHIDNERRATKRFQKFLNGRVADPVANATDQYHSVIRSDDFFEIKICDNPRLFVRPDLLQGW